MNGDSIFYPMVEFNVMKRQVGLNRVNGRKLPRCVTLNLMLKRRVCVASLAPPLHRYSGEVARHHGSPHIVG
jgi:hypothetical protein